MAFVQIVVIPGVTAEQYDEVMDTAYGGTPPDGELFHVAGPSEEGWYVIDGWESRTQCDRSMQKLMPALREAGVSMSGPPKEFEIHKLELGN
jgi:hypothetical protein